MAWGRQGSGGAGDKVTSGQKRWSVLRPPGRQLTPEKGQGVRSDL